MQGITSYYNYTNWDNKRQLKANFANKFNLLFDVRYIPRIQPRTLRTVYWQDFCTQVPQQGISQSGSEYPELPRTDSRKLLCKKIFTLTLDCSLQGFHGNVTWPPTHLLFAQQRDLKHWHTTVLYRHVTRDGNWTDTKWKASCILLLCCMATYSTGINRNNLADPISDLQQRFNIKHYMLFSNITLANFISYKTMVTSYIYNMSTPYIHTLGKK